MESIDKNPLYRIANPRSIVFFGASNNMSSMGTNLLASLQEIGFEGPIYPVHPKAKEVRNLQAYRSVADLPEAPDLAVVVLPNRLVPEIMEACGRRGIKHAVIVSGGFKEAGAEGLRMEKSLTDIAERYGMRFLGPNCLGVASPHHRLNTTFLSYEGEPGFIGMASQSGSFITQMFNYLARYALGFSTAFSVGNEADVDIVDCLQYLAACPRTRVIALYIEGIRRGRAFLEIAKSITPHKPVVALYVGGSETGKRAGVSHTGALAGPDPLYDGVFRQSGIIRARSITEMIDFCQVLGRIPAPRGNRVIIQTHSGGPGATAADACDRAGLTLPALSPATRDRLAEFVPQTGSLQNPVDLTFTKNPLHYCCEIPEVLLQEENADMLIIYLLMPTKAVIRALEQMGLSPDQIRERSRELITSQCESLQRLQQTFSKPIVGFSFRSLEEPFLQGLLERGVAVYPGPERAARAAAALAGRRSGW